MSFDLIIRGGTIVTASDTYKADIGVSGGTIVALGMDLTDAREIVDATGMLVMPGGIDSHVHLDQDGAEGVIMGDGFETGTRSAIAGGNTTVLPFCVQKRGQTLREAMEDYKKRAEGNCYSDVSYHLIITDPTPAVLGQELPALIRDGYTSFKIFMTYEGMALNDREMLEVMSVARETGAMVMVHAENFDAIRFLTDRLEQAGHTAPRFHGRSRPIIVEREATHRAISLAELIDVPVMIVHVSNREAMDEIRRAQSKGLKVYGETCPQYLVLTEADMDKEGMEGAKFVCSPPPRDTESQKACWEGLQQDIFQVFSSDHCPYRYDDTSGKLVPAGLKSFRWVPNGIPGVETRMPILFSEGVVKGRIDINRFVALTSTNHAKIYGLYPKKGTIAIGSDADLAIWDPKKKVTISQEILHHGCDYTPFEGIEVTGWPVTTILRGKVVVRDGEVIGEKGFGQELQRAISPLARASGLSPTE